MFQFAKIVLKVFGQFMLIWGAFKLGILIYKLQALGHCTKILMIKMLIDFLTFTFSWPQNTHTMPILMINLHFKKLQIIVDFMVLELNVKFVMEHDYKIWLLLLLIMQSIDTNPHQTSKLKLQVMFAFIGCLYILSFNRRNCHVAFNVNMPFFLCSPIP
jgi:hypothetical protein